MKVISWNIWGGKFLDKVIEQLHSEDADIVTLQEVKVQDGNNAASLIAEKLGYHVSFCKSFTTDRHHPTYDIGNAILTKIKPERMLCHFLSDLSEYQGSAVTEPRTAVEVTLQINETPLTVLTTHLGYSDRFGESEIRDRQLEKLIRLIPHTPSLILTGDFNSLPTSTVITTLETHLANADTKKEDMSFTDYKDEKKTQYRIDYIFTSKNIDVKDFAIGDTEASDHKPLIATLSL